MGYTKVDNDRWRRILDALKESGWEEYPALGKLTHFDHLDKYYVHPRSSERDVLDALDAVIDVLGLRNEYPDVTSETTNYSIWYVGGVPRTVTDRGAARFRADVLAARESKAGAEALARIQSALKKK